MAELGKGTRNSGAMTRRELLGLAGSSALALSLAAYGVPTAASAATPLTRGKGTGNAVFGFSVPVDQIDPGTSALAGDAKVVFNIYDTLFRSEGDPPQLRGHVCQRYQVSEDGRTYTFRIRRGVKFHDGTELKASDVRYSWVRTLELKRAPSVIWQGIVTPEMIKVLDDYTLRVELTKPYAALPDTLMWLYVANQKQVEAHITGNDYGTAWLNQTDAGSGPFAIRSHQPAVRIILERFPDHWKGWGPLYLDGYVYEVIREPATLRLALERGNVHVTDLFALSVDDMELAERGGLVRIAEDRAMSIVQLKMNNQKFPTNNKHFQKAMSFAFNYNSVTKDLLRGRTEKSEGVIPKGLRFWKGYKGTRREYVTDLDRARFHLRESGVDPKIIGPLGYLYRGDDPLQRDYGLILKNDLAKLGIEIEMQGVTIPVLLERLKSPQTAPNFTRISVSTLIVDPDHDCRRLFYSRTWRDVPAPFFAASFYGNREVDGLIERGQFTVDPQARKAIYERIQDIVQDDAVDIWVDQQHWLTALNKKLKGYKYVPLGVRPIDFSPLYFES